VRAICQEKFINNIGRLYVDYRVVAATVLCSYDDACMIYDLSSCYNNIATCICV
jgi:hypothetical protein